MKNTNNVESLFQHSARSPASNGLAICVQIYWQSSFSSSEKESKTGLSHLSLCFSLSFSFQVLITVIKQKWDAECWVRNADVTVVVGKEKFLRHDVQVSGVLAETVFCNKSDQKNKLHLNGFSLLGILVLTMTFISNAWLYLTLEIGASWSENPILLLSSVS